MKIIFSLIAFTLCLVFLDSCYYDKEQVLYHSGGAACTDTAGTVSYAQKVVPMLQQFCYSCHTGSFPSGNIAMGTYANDKVIAQNGKLYGTISHSSGYIPMPQGMPQLSNCQIAVIKKWVDSGIPNN
ncbi:MAG: hypothetical protein Q8941_15670 [Bacteroidota bacterium]|nr:hypothetical protein [Bacteroidota bacterium]